MLRPRFFLAGLRLRRIGECSSCYSANSYTSSVKRRRMAKIDMYGSCCSASPSSLGVGPQHRLTYSSLHRVQSFHAHDPPPASDTAISFAFVEDDGKETAVQVPEGTTILEAAHSNDVPLEGSCEGQCSCSTCHVILSDELYEALPEPSVEEEDMLDLAACLTDTSRLGCQIRVNKHFEGEKIKLPAITRNFFVDGHKPSPH
ncbi:adrenodoxin-type ferredoxin [Cyclospora cayetanensis]|uniref:2Fe-2S ferredoxin n=1 Tax=Cyclospora cayetanensis TaxID=88456 RepID=A0A1D3CUK4_9EIME|nr:adrenodoxin-type ferredoxin [Cyclospora cayetanensis]